MTSILTDASKVRLLIGDSDEADLLLSVDELAYILSVESNIYQAAIMACDAILAKLARYPDFQMGRTKESQSQMTAQFEAVRTRIQNAVTRGEQKSLYVGQIFEDEIDEDEADTDLIQPHFKVGIHDNTS
jgi:hypothetical protein